MNANNVKKVPTLRAERAIECMQYGVWKVRCR